MDGIILIDKPQKFTSRDVVNIVSKSLKIKKVGHMGTLDPIATGVLIIGVGRGTKLTDVLLNEDKEYVAEVTLGIATDTLDTDGKVIDKVKVNKISKDQLINILDTFIGNQQQEVPLYSSIKIKGKKLYEYARKNEEVTLPIRNINIKEIELIGDITYRDDIIKFSIKCLVSKGTYIRSLIRDIGIKLGYPACMSALRRTKQGSFKILECNNIDGEYRILSLREALKDYPMIEVNPSMEVKILNGMKIDKFFSEEKVGILNNKGELIAIYRQDPNNINKVKPFKILKTLDFL